MEYRLTEQGQTLEPVISALKVWGDGHVAGHSATTDRTEAPAAA